VNAIKDLIAKAKKLLHTAESALGLEDYDSCASRCYYAMFFMAQAALLTRELSSSSHRGVISLFGQHFIKTGTIERRLGRTLNDAYDKRLAGDYEARAVVTQDEARALLEAAHDFVQRVEDYLGEWMEEGKEE
jgi:uncharacterized protein (UPF0332 family)